MIVRRERETERKTERRGREDERRGEKKSRKKKWRQERKASRLVRKGKMDSEFSSPQPQGCKNLSLFLQPGENLGSKVPWGRDPMLCVYVADRRRKIETAVPTDSQSLDP